MATRSKTLSLHRAYFNEGFNGNLETVLRGSFDRLPTTRDRIIQVDLLSNQFFAGLEADPSEEGIFVRVLEFEQGAIGVINLDATDQSAAVEEFMHPKRRDFLKDEIVLYVVGDHVIACNLKNKGGTLCDKVLEFASKADVLSSDVRMKIADVPDSTTLERVRDTGVKQVDFAVTSYFECLAVNTRHQAGARVMQMVFGTPSSEESIRHRANALGRLTLKRGRFQKDEVQRDDWLTGIGNELLVAGAVDSYLIVLEDGSKISNSSLKKSKAVNLRRQANSFSFEHAKVELRNYFLEVQRDGALGV